MLAFVAVAAGAWVFASRPAPVYSLVVSGEDLEPPQELTYGAWPELANPTFHAAVIQKLTEEGVSFISADLERMELVVYQNGVPALAVPILSKGKAGSWWETPAGFYQVQSMAENHFSSFGSVYQPWSIAFQGNFFIHGWPYYPDGTPVAQSHSGGCIRLSTEDAEQVYALAALSMPVLVYDSAKSGDGFQYRSRGPEIAAPIYLIADVRNSTVLASRREEDSVPIASITKLITGLVVTDYLNLDRVVTVPAGALVYSAVPRLRTGLKASVHDLLFPLLMESSNEAAEALASVLGRGYFISLMNNKAAAIGLDSTTLVDPTGAGEGNVSTAEDLFALLKYAADNRRFLLAITNGSLLTEDVYGKVTFANLDNFNEAPKVGATLVGGKVGQTLAANETYAGVFSVSIGGEPRDIAVVILGSSNVQSDLGKAIEFVKEHYEPQ